MRGIVIFVSGAALAVVALVASNSNLRLTTAECKRFVTQGQTICSDDQRWASAVTVEAAVKDNSELERIYASVNK